MSTEYIPTALRADFDRWKVRKNKPEGKEAPQTFESLKNDLKAVFAYLPETVEIPFSHTPEGERYATFSKAVPPEYAPAIDRKLLRDPIGFDRVASWDGSFPGPCANGPTSTAKTRAAWACLRRLWVQKGIGFTWRPARKLITAIEEMDGSVEGLLYRNQASKIWFIDDADKLNWQFQSHPEALFAFYDTIYRQNIPCITTTNKDRNWWVDKMGEAFARRLFDEAHFPVDFKTSR